MQVLKNLLLISAIGFLFSLTLLTIHASDLVKQSTATLKEVSLSVKQVQRDLSATSQNLNTSISTLNKDLGSLHKTIAHGDQLVQNANRRLTDTSQNLNAVLIQWGLASDEIRQASTEQRELLKKTSTETADLVTNTNLAVEQTRQTLADASAVLQSAGKVIGDPAIPSTLNHIDQVGDNLAKISTIAEKKVEQLAKPASFIKQLVLSVLDWGSKIVPFVK